jgi:hypothetical protein
MKSMRLMGVVALTLLLATGVAGAGDDSNHHIINQNLSKRPYQEAPKAADAEKSGQFEGATLVTEEGGEKKAGPTQYQKFRIHMLGQRPFMDGNK